MDIEQYTKIMSSQITKSTLLTIALVICISIVFCFLYKAIKNKDTDGKIACACVIILATAILPFCVTHIVRLSIDKNTESYIMYSGDYEVVSETGLRFSPVQVVLKEYGQTITLEEGVSYRLHLGTYHGYIVYSERTKVLVDYYYDESDKN